MKEIFYLSGVRTKECRSPRLLEVFRSFVVLVMDILDSWELGSLDVMHVRIDDTVSVGN